MEFNISFQDLVAIANDSNIDLTKYKEDQVIKGLKVELEHGSKNPITDVLMMVLLRLLK